MVMRGHFCPHTRHAGENMAFSLLPISKSPCRPVSSVGCGDQREPHGSRLFFSTDAIRFSHDILLEYTSVFSQKTPKRSV